MAKKDFSGAAKSSLKKQFLPPPKSMGDFLSDDEPEQVAEIETVEGPQAKPRPKKKPFIDWSKVEEYREMRQQKNFRLPVRIIEGLRAHVNKERIQNKNHRYAEADAVIEALENYLKGKGIDV